MPIETSRGPDPAYNSGSGASGGGSSFSRDNDQDLIAEAVRRFARAEEHEAFMRQEALEDDKFVAGDQWPEQIRSDRTIQKRPCLTINKLATFCHQIENEHKMNRQAIKFSPVGDRSDPETAKMLQGMVRQIERTGGANEAYDTGFLTMVRGGWGFWRVRADYEEDQSFNQVLLVDRIPNRFSVYCDPDAKLPTSKDKDWCFITSYVPRDEFRRENPNADPMEWQEQGAGDVAPGWNTQTHLRVAEYYYFDTKDRTLVALKDGHTGWKDELAPEIREAVEADKVLPEADRTLFMDERSVPVKTLKWCKLTAKNVLERQELPGKWIPVVRCIGDEMIIEGKSCYVGVVRFAKDPQRMYNFWSTAETELIALQPKAPWIMEEGQIEGHEKRWREANITPQPYLLYKGVSVGGKQAPAPQRQPFQGSPDGVVKAKIGAAQDMQATTGIRFDATLQERMHDESGAALVELKRIGEMGQFHFADNFNKAQEFTGEIFLDLLPHYYDTRRAITILREDDTEEQVAIDPQQQKPFTQEQGQDGKVTKIFNPNVGKYAVVVTTGPNFATKRVEAAEQMMQFLKFLPQTAPLVADLFAKNMDWPDAELIAERLASQLPPNLLMKNMQNLPPQARAIISSQQQQLAKLSEDQKQALHLLGEKEREHAQEQERINTEREKVANDFEAKMAKIAADLMTAQQDAENERAAKFTEIVGKMADIQLAVEGFVQERDIANQEMDLERESRDFDREEKERDRASNDEAQKAEITELKSLLKDALKKPKIKGIKPVTGKTGKMARVEYDDGSSREVKLH